MFSFWFCNLWLNGKRWKVKLLLSVLVIFMVLIGVDIVVFDLGDLLELVDCFVEFVVRVMVGVLVVGTYYFKDMFMV